MNLKVPLCFIISDAQGGDYLCGRPPNYGSSAKIICITCSDFPLDCGTPTSECHKITTYECQQAYTYFLENNNDMTELDKLYLYNCKKAFHDICFGGDKYGINSAIFTDILHAGEKKDLQNMLLIFLNFSINRM